MDVSLFDYELPRSLVAQRPTALRGDSRLLVLRRSDGHVEHRAFADIVEYLNPGDVLVTNDTKVIRARLIGEKEGTGARVELFLIRKDGMPNHYSEDWKVLARPAKRLKKGQRVVFGDGLSAEMLGVLPDGCRLARFTFKGSFGDIVERIGHVPLPPYIGREDEPLDAERYQTVYANEPGSVAAPTAGLHFTESLLATLRMKGVVVVPVTLEVGLGTFMPVKTDLVEEHHMHAERYVIPEDAARAVNAAKTEGRRVVCVGTTVVRALESAAADGGRVPVKAGFCETDIFIYPGFTFRICDALITNFHLPKSTLLMLVSAFAGRERILEAYAEARANRYRFFSYGDAMFILPRGGMDKRTAKNI
ncbi:MAG: tRNA preQ1(34) S-adenosylmethionine ribosyltransferase-isomerase QueA [Clostridiales Family XIII bacterium]|jgi:S-adenosylmethionine:tRNA ribosyltransferase-isomerase|nr:tRNA preQ1(34) S-adenosylmethionine ribosyltransferase-isomerase QueA [Clostridiales Family XIII bacterium]